MSFLWKTDCGCTGLFKLDCINRVTCAHRIHRLFTSSASADVIKSRWYGARMPVIDFHEGRECGEVRAHGLEKATTQRVVLSPERQPSPNWIWSQFSTGAHPDVSSLLMNFVSSPLGQFCVSKHRISYDLEVNTNDLPCEIWLADSVIHLMLQMGTPQMTARFSEIDNLWVGSHFHKICKHVYSSVRSFVNF